MKVQKGVVKYRDRDDINCTYGITDDGRTYYFLDETDQKKFKNGNRIASTDLKEAIDPMAKASHIGVIDDNGREVIPFTNRMIKPVDEDTILVEPAEAVSESVIEAVNLRNDPLAATKLVSTPALIKDRLNTKMGGEGRYLFNDQFSEATLCDIDGNNLLGNEYYSFIASVDSKMYFSKNTPDCEIVEYTLIPGAIQNNPDAQDINVSEVHVSQDVVEGALAAETTTNEPIADNYQVEVPTGMEEQANQTEVAPIAPPVEEDVAVASETQNEPAPVSTEETVEAAPAEAVTPTTEENILIENNQGTVESQSVGFSLGDVNGDLMGNMVAPVEVPTQNVPTQDVENVTVPTDVANESVMANASVEVPPVTEEAMNVEVPVAPEESVNQAEVAQETPVNEGEKIEIPSAQADVSTDMGIQVPVVEADAVEENPAVPVEETPAEEANAETSDEKVTAESPVEESNVEEESAEVPVEEESVSEESTAVDSSDAVTSELEETPAETTPVEEDYSDEVVEENHDEEESIPMNETPEKDVSLSSFFDDVSADHDLDDDMGLENDIFKDSVIQTDRIQREDEFDDSYNRDYSHSNVLPGKDTIIVDVAKSMSELMKQNREQRAMIEEYRERLEKLNASRRNIANRATAQEQKIDALNTKIHNYEATITKLESRNQVLENRVHDQDRIIDTQAHELEVMRPQLQGKEELVRLLADAKTLLGDDSSYNYDSSDSYYRRAA